MDSFLRDLMQLAPRMEMVGAVFGVCGAWVIAAGPRLAFYGFCCYLVSNVAWISFASYHGHWWQVGQQCCFFGSTLLGLWKWGRLKFLAPEAEAPEPQTVAIK